MDLLTTGTQSLEGLSRLKIEMIQMIQNKINYLGSKLPATSSTTYFSTSGTQFDIPLQYIKGNVSNSLERFDRNINDFDEFPKINIEQTKSRHQQNNAFMGLPSYSSSTFSINPLNTISNMPRSMQASNKNLIFSRNPSVESRHHLKMQNSDENNIMVNDYSEFSENMDSNIRCSYCISTSNKLKSFANSVKEIIEQRNLMSLDLIK